MNDEDDDYIRNIHGNNDMIMIVIFEIIVVIMIVISTTQITTLMSVASIINKYKRIFNNNDNFYDLPVFISPSSIVQNNSYLYPIISNKY